MLQNPQIFNQWMSLICRLKKPRQSAVIVGGFVRDWLLHRVKYDIDIAVSSDALDLAKRFAKAVKGTFVLLDEEHGCARIVVKVKEQIYTIDFSDFRAKTLKGDLGLRDFTINSLTIPITSDLNADTIDASIQDFDGALADLKSKRIKMNAARVFDDDPLRLLRAFSLSAQTGFTIDRATLAQIKKINHRIVESAAERAREEIFKILHSDRTTAIIRLMDKVGLLDYVLPQLAIMKKVEQGGYHHLDVFDHSVLVLEEYENLLVEYKDHQGIQDFLAQEIGGDHSRRALLKLAALTHDIGKPATKKFDGTRFTFHGHENVGAGIVRHMAKQLRLTVKERYFLEDIVKLHLRPGYLSNFEKPSEKIVYRFMRDAKGEAVTLALLAMADQRATKGPLSTADKLAHHAAICQDIIRRQFEAPAVAVPKKRLISGHDLVKALKLKPSPLFAKILTTVEEEKSLGRITTKAQALALAKKIVNGTYEGDSVK